MLSMARMCRCSGKEACLAQAVSPTDRIRSATHFQPGNLGTSTGCPTTLHTLLAWFNSCAFVKQPVGTFGNTGRNSLLGPGRWNFDASIWRTFVVTERLKMDFRFEGFNVFNHPQFGNPNVNLNSSSPLDYISSASAMRIMQAAVKFNF